MKNEKITLGDDGISLRTSERRPHTIIRCLQSKIQKTHDCK